MPNSIIAQDFPYAVFQPSAQKPVRKPPAAQQAQNVPPPNSSSILPERAARSEERTEDQRLGSEGVRSTQPGGGGTREAGPAVAYDLAGALAASEAVPLAKIKKSATPPAASTSSGSPWLLPRRSYADTLALAVASGVDLAGPGLVAGGGVGLAPYSNSGAQSTSIAQTPPKTPPSLPFPSLDVASEVSPDALAWKFDGFLIDWLRFVVIPEEQQQTIKRQLMADWGSEAGDWSEQDSGHMGYRRCYRSDRATIYYDHVEPGRGICFDISGKGCRKIEASAPGAVGSMWTNLLHLLTSTPGVHVTRLDVALDDRAGLVDLDRVGECIRSCSVVSRFKAAFHIEKVSLSSGAGGGKTINFGSRSSDMMVRMYNKAAEQKQEAAGHWVRVEAEAKDEVAVALAKSLAAAGSHAAGAVVAGVLRNYLTFREASETDTNRSRWPVVHWWLEFLQDVERLRLAVAKAEPSILRARAWMEHQVAPLLAVLFHPVHGIYGLSLLLALLEVGEGRLRPKHHKMRSTERAAIALGGPVGGPTGF